MDSREDSRTRRRIRIMGSWMMHGVVLKQEEEAEEEHDHVEETHASETSAGDRECKRRRLDDAGEGNTMMTCFWCNTTFGSVKKLSGHMRVHKERPCKGISAPPPEVIAKYKLQQTNAEASVAPESRSVDPEDFDEDELEVADILLSMSTGFNSGNTIRNVDVSTTKKKKKNEKKKKEHKCQHCKRAFEDGRELGGHMRAHFTGELRGKSKRKDGAAEGDAIRLP